MKHDVDHMYYGVIERSNVIGIDNIGGCKSIMCDEPIAYDSILTFNDGKFVDLFDESIKFDDSREVTINRSGILTVYRLIDYIRVTDCVSFKENRQSKGKVRRMVRKSINKDI